MASYSLADLSTENPLDLFWVNVNSFIPILKAHAGVVITIVILLVFSYLFRLSSRLEQQSKTLNQVKRTTSRSAPTTGRAASPARGNGH